MTSMIGSVDSPTPEWAKWIDKRKHLQELQKDPDWMLQAGLGDVEFEQDLYDAFKYSPAGENKLSLKALRDFGENQKEQDVILTRHPTPRRYSGICLSFRMKF